MTAFSDDMRRRALLAGLSIRALAVAIPVDPSHLARIARGERQPTPELATAIDRHLNADGELAALAERRPCTPAEQSGDGRRPLDDADAERIRDTIAHLVSLDTAHGSDGLHGVAARAFRSEADHLAVAGATTAADADIKAAVAELGEVAAWLAYDAEQQDTSRAVASEALLIARMAGDTSMERFLLSHLSMQAVYLGRGAEGLAIADRVLADEPMSERVRGMFAVRRARALALLGSGEALDELGRARSVLLEGVGPGDPQWTWWLHEAEMAIHEARIRAATDDRRGAVTASHRAVASLPERQGRDGVLYRAWLLRDLVDAHAWRDAEQVARDLIARADVAGTARVPRIVRGALAQVEGPAGQRVPRWLRDAVREAARTWT